MISKEGLAKFKALYKKEFGIELKDKEAVEKANRILRMYHAVYAKELSIKMKKNGKKIQYT